MAIASRPTSSQYRENWARVFSGRGAVKEDSIIFERRVLLHYNDGRSEFISVGCADRKPLPNRIIHQNINFKRKHGNSICYFQAAKNK